MIAREIYHETENVDPNEHPKPSFDMTECISCPNRKKLGVPYSNAKKTWRCLDKACHEKKTSEAEEARINTAIEEIKSAKSASGDSSGAEEILDCTKLQWRDYQSFDDHKKIDKPGECKGCEHRVLGKLWSGRVEPVCINVKCFMEKKRLY